MSRTIQTLEETIRFRLCSVCHVALVYPHPQEEMAAKGWFKCILCGFCKQKVKA